MSLIRCIYQGAPPDFPASDQHPDAVRFGPIEVAGGIVFVDAIGSEPSPAEIAAILDPPPPPAPTPAEKLAASGLTVAELKALLGLPA